MASSVTASNCSATAATTYLLLDLNGNLHVGDQPTPNAIEALSRLSGLAQSTTSSGRQLRISFCSNSSKESTQTLVSRLRRMGFTDEEAMPEGSVFTSLDAARRLLLSGQKKRRTLLLLNEDAMQSFQDEDAKGRQSRYFKPPQSTLPADLNESQQSALQSCDSVLIGLAPDLMRYEWLTEAFRVLTGEYASKDHRQEERPDPLLVATHSGRYLRPGDGGPLALGPGPFVQALAHAADLGEEKVICVGKPERAFFAQCLEGMGWKRREGSEDQAWIVGDDARQDLSFPQLKNGEQDPLKGLKVRRGLVKTGKYREGDEEKVEGGGAGDVGVWDSFAHWVDDFIREWKSCDSQ